jgi:asparagine synthase (glutamine-hydrolysing)
MKDIAVTSSQFTPGTFKVITKNLQSNETTIQENTYYDVTSNLGSLDKYQFDESQLLNFIRTKLTAAVEKRLISDRPVCALLSGGLDSSLVCSIASKLLKEKGIPLYTFSIGIPGSPDNVYAKKVADYIGSTHTVVDITSDDALNALKDVIWSTETFDITTIRASTGQYLVSKYIAENTDFKVVLSGDGSDEVTSGYLENFLAPSLEELHNHAIDRVKNIHFYDVLRADRATSIHGLELRVPFLDVSFVDFYLQIDPKLRQPVKGEQCEKYLLRKAFTNGYLPDEVLWRQKEAFSDGISSQENSWHSIIQTMCDKLITDEELANNSFENCKPETKEAFYYRQVFTSMYGSNFSNIIPAFWMPKWSNTKDPSARSLKVYNSSNEKEKTL